MRHARKAAVRAATALLLSAIFTSSGAALAHAIESTGGTPAPVAAVATRGTGGTVYTVPPPKRRPARKTARPVHRSHRAPKPKAAPPKPGAPAPLSPLAPPAPPSPPAGSGPGPGVPSPAQTAAEGAVFPVVGPHSFGDAANRFGAPRAGYTHQGQDVLAVEGLPVVAPLAGSIITTAYQAGGAGWYVVEHTLNGLDFFYAHCQSGSLAGSMGQAVSAGQELCKVGQTGDATASHLHFEVWVGGWRVTGGYPIDPLPYLEAWERPAGG